MEGIIFKLLLLLLLLLCMAYVFIQTHRVFRETEREKRERPNSLVVHAPLVESRFPRGPSAIKVHPATRARVLSLSLCLSLALLFCLSFLFRDVSSVSRHAGALARQAVVKQDARVFLFFLLPPYFFLIIFSSIFHQVHLDKEIWHCRWWSSAF